jgi:hypothetical protein
MAAMDGIWHKDRRERILGPTRRLLQLSEMLDCESTDISGLENFLTIYIKRRIDNPLPSWWACLPATVAADVSAIVASTRDDSIPVPPYGGPRPRAVLAEKGAFERPDHCATYPVSLQQLVDRMPKASAPIAVRIHHDALMLQSLCGHRGGMAPRLKMNMWRKVGPGYAMLWTRRTKVRRGDRSAKDPVMRPQLSCAAGAIMDGIMRRAPASGTMFPGVTGKSLNEYLKTLFPSIPDHFVLRVHGIRAGTDTVLQALGLPRDVVEAVGWWTRERRASGYYASVVMNKIFIATSIMHYVEIAAFSPGNCRVLSLHGVTIPDWSKIEELAEDAGHFARNLPELPSQNEMVDDHDDSSDDEHRVMIGTLATSAAQAPARVATRARAAAKR